jgi:hypothetical protein
MEVFMGKKSDTREGSNLKKIWIFSIALLMSVCLPLGSWATEDPKADFPQQRESGEKSLTEINKKLINPVSDLWSISFQRNNYLLDSGLPGKGEYWNSNLNLLPVLPMALTKNWNLITRPIIPLLISQPHPKSGNQSEVETTYGFGDISLVEMVSPSPNLAGNWLLGFGPTFIFPTASSDWTGQGKMQAGPAAFIGHLSKNWGLGVFYQQWWSFSGDNGRPDTSQMNLQPIVTYFLPDNWTISYSGNILANWKAEGSNVWTIPVGLSVAKLFKLARLPMKISLAGQYMPIHPDHFGQEWNIQLQVSLVLPGL